MNKTIKKLLIALAIIGGVATVGGCSYSVYMDYPLSHEEYIPNGFTMDFCRGDWFYDHYQDDYYLCQFYYKNELKEIEVYNFKTIYTSDPELKDDNQLTITITTTRSNTYYSGELIFWR